MNTTTENFSCADLDHLMPPSPTDLKQWPKPICSFTQRLAQGVLGAPPHGAYFWPDKRGGGWCLQVCYDRSNPEHLNYAQALLLLSQNDLTGR